MRHSTFNLTIALNIHFGNKQAEKVTVQRYLIKCIFTKNADPHQTAYLWHLQKVVFLRIFQIPSAREYVPRLNEFIPEEYVEKSVIMRSEKTGRSTNFLLPLLLIILLFVLFL